MASEWRIVRLGELGEVNRGRSRHRPRNAIHLYGGPYPFIQTGDIKSANGLITSHTQTYNDAGLAQSRLWPSGTMVITIAANIAETAILSYPACFPDSVVGFIANEKKANVRFIEYLFRFLKHQIQHENVGTGSVQDNINLQTLERLELKVPNLEEQHAIVHILGTLDDKIELNRRMNETLESMARALFKAWFVDFEPVRAKLEGRWRRGQSLPGLPAHLYDLFPDRLVDSKLGEIPEGWEIGTVGEIATQAIGGLWGNDTPSAGLVPCICLRGCDMEDLRMVGHASEAPTRYIKEKLIDTRLPTEADVLIAASGAGPCGRPLWCSSQLHELFEHPVVYSNFVKRFTTQSSAHALYLDRLLMGKFVDRSITDYINGTSVPNLDATGLLAGHTILIPPIDILELFKRLCEPIYVKLYSKENVDLAQLRDNLLPKLISGELRVPDVARIVEART